MPFIETSAINSMNVEEAFMRITKDLIAKKYVLCACFMRVGCLLCAALCIPSQSSKASMRGRVGTGFCRLRERAACFTRPLSVLSLGGNVPVGSRDCCVSSMVDIASVLLAFRYSNVLVSFCVATAGVTPPPALASTAGPAREPSACPPCPAPIPRGKVAAAAANLWDL
jgi:hypothetical protein